MKSLYRKLALPLLLIAAFALGGCASLDAQYAAKIKTSADLILPEYRDYFENDENLDEASKKARRDNVNELEALLKEGVGQ